MPNIKVSVVLIVPDANDDHDLWSKATNFVKYNQQYSSGIESDEIIGTELIKYSLLFNMNTTRRMFSYSNLNMSHHSVKLPLLDSGSHHEILMKKNPYIVGVFEKGNSLTKETVIGIPGGSLDNDELVHEGAERELYEETGIKLSFDKNIQMMLRKRFDYDKLPLVATFNKIKNEKTYTSYVYFILLPTMSMAMRQTQ